MTARHPTPQDDPEVTAREERARRLLSEAADKNEEATEAIRDFWDVVHTARSELRKAGFPSPDQMERAR